MIERVSCRIVSALDEHESVLLYLPLFGKRSLRYVPPEEFAAKESREKLFTVALQDRLCYGICTEDAPPGGAFTVSSVTAWNQGSRRIRHLKITGTIPSAEENTEEVSSL